MVKSMGLGLLLEIRLKVNKATVMVSTPGFTNVLGQSGKGHFKWLKRSWLTYSITDSTSDASGVRTPHEA